MAINITNRTNSPIGVWAVPTENKLIPSMSDVWTENVTPTLAAQAIVDILVKARVVTVQTYVDPGPIGDDE